MVGVWNGQYATDGLGRSTWPRHVEFKQGERGRIGWVGVELDWPSSQRWPVVSLVSVSVAGLIFVVVNALIGDGRTGSLTMGT